MNILSTLIRRCLAALVVVFLLLPIAYAQAAPEFLPVDQITKGMHGVAKTMVSGNTIEEFGVEVLDVMKQKGPSGDLLLVRTYGDVIDRTGGIAQGMSGSPVYIDGKLVGAIAYGWSLTDHKIGMVTPIADMLKLWEMPDGQQIEKTVENVEIAPESPAFPENPSVTSALIPAPKVQPAATPLMAAGFGEQSLKMLADKLKPYNLVPYAVGGGSSDENNGIAYKNVEPGSTIGVQMVRGDVSLGALGTVTYVEGNKILAFGHPFLKRGKVNYFLADADVFTTVSGLENSFKVGTATDTIGVINQDRGAGIAGTLGKFPNVVPLRIKVTDKNLGRTDEMWAQVIKDEELAPTLAAVSVFNAIEKTTDRIGSGTARVSFEISAVGIPGDELKRENMFYTQGNIGELAVAEVHEALSLLASNQFSPVDIMDVKVNVKVDSERRTATITEAKVSTATVKPGDKVEITVKLNPYRQNTPITRQVTFTVPKQQQQGTLMLSVHGGGVLSVAQLMGKRQNEEEDIIKLLVKPRPKSLNEAVKELANRDRNNDIVVEVLELAGVDGMQTDGKKQKNVVDKFENKPNPAMLNTAVKQPPKASAGSANASAKTDKDSENQRKVHLTTDYIIDGETQVVLNVVK